MVIWIARSRGTRGVGRLLVIVTEGTDLIPSDDNGKRVVDDLLAALDAILSTL